MYVRWRTALGPGSLRRGRQGPPRPQIPADAAGCELGSSDYAPRERCLEAGSCCKRPQGTSGTLTRRRALHPPAKPPACLPCHMVPNLDGSRHGREMRVGSGLSDCSVTTLVAVHEGRKGGRQPIRPLSLRCPISLCRVVEPGNRSCKVYRVGPCIKWAATNSDTRALWLC